MKILKSYHVNCENLINTGHVSIFGIATPPQTFMVVERERERERERESNLTTKQTYLFAKVRNHFPFPFINCTVKNFMATYTLYNVFPPLNAASHFTGFSSISTAINCNYIAYNHIKPLVKSSNTYKTSQKAFKKAFLPEGKTILPKGKTDLPSGKINLPEGKTKLPLGKINLPSGRTNLPEGKINLPEGKINLPEGKTSLPLGKTKLPEGKKDGVKPKTINLAIFLNKPKQ